MPAEVGYDGFMRSDQRSSSATNSAARWLGYGPRTRKRAAIGSPVVALPLLRRGGRRWRRSASRRRPRRLRGADGRRGVADVPGAQRPSPERGRAHRADGGRQTCRSARRDRKGDVAIVIGCGPIGLTVITMLKARGVRTVVGERLLRRAGGRWRRRAARTSSSTRRRARHTTGPGPGHLETSPTPSTWPSAPWRSWAAAGVPWYHVWRIADTLGVQPKRPVIFECVGLPGMLDGIISAAPLFSRVVVVGVCMEPDRIRPAMAINKEIDLRFVVGYTPLEFRDTLHLLAEGKVDADPIVTGTVGLPEWTRPSPHWRPGDARQDPHRPDAPGRWDRGRLVTRS